MELAERARELQDRLALIDLMGRPAARSGWTELLVKELRNLKVRMYQEKGHSRPHVHIEYGKEYHEASYSVLEGERLAGNLSRKYDREVTAWIERNREMLLILWGRMQKGESIESILAVVQGRT